MLVKMQFLSITGPVNQIDRITQTYLEGRAFDLENALTELNTPAVSTFTEENPYKELLLRSESLIGSFPPEDVERPRPAHMSLEEIEKIIRELSSNVAETNTEKANLTARLNEVEGELDILRPYRTLDANLKELTDFSHLMMRMGHMPQGQYTNFISYVADDLEAVFIKTTEDREDVYGLYFAPAPMIRKVDETMQKFGFTETKPTRSYMEPPETACRKLTAERETLQANIAHLDVALKEHLQAYKEQLLTAHQSLIRMSNNFDIRNYAVITESEHQKYFVLCGWMPYDQAEEVKALMNNDPAVYYDTEIGAAVSKLTPPTKIKNPKFFKPFESFIRMYGIPGYNEFDPTIFLALTYTIIFGMMFGDVGQGLLLVVGGFFLYQFKKIDLAAIIACAGIFSVIFGFLYGSFFGFEDIIRPLWMNPMHDIQTVLIISVSFGIGLILITMVLNIIVKIKQRDWAGLLFHQNGIAGLVFYGCVLTAVICAILGYPVPAGWILGILLGVPLLLIALQKPLGNLLKRRKRLIEGGKGGFFIEAFFELFEIILNYITNTISFVRIGAFALSHAGMMLVVMQLSNAASGHPNWLVVVLGNILVMGLEGLIVGIQVLRLEYYELFSRFYSGDGREFHSYLK
ncbi:MAG: V-type ATPase 116kDa subunit family protein [Eubacteriales bacterium]|nr:V-type ATPase 116kDa subunit family protein [Eubacteriales bacterium]